jgi:hypothetical protein
MTKRIAILFTVLLAVVAGAAGLTAFRTHWRWGAYYPAESLDHVLREDFHSRTNGRGRGYQSGWHWVWLQSGLTLSASNAVWNTNSLLFKNGALATGASAMVYQNERVVPAGTTGFERFCMLTRRIGVAHGHHHATPYYLTNALTTSSNLVFVSSNNVVHRVGITAIYGGFTDWTLMGDPTNTIEDHSYVVLSSDLPAGVETMRIATPLATNGNIGLGCSIYLNPDNAAYFPGYTVCQHMCIAPHVGYTHDEYVGSPTGWHVLGDSGSPAFILLDNECLYTGGWTYSSATADLLKAIAVINNHHTFDTNDAANQLRFVSLTNWPSWPY